MINIVINGVCGRMGRQILQLAVQERDVDVIGVVEHKDHPHAGRPAGSLIGSAELVLPVQSNLDDVQSRPDVIIDFSTPESSLDALKYAAGHGASLVVGTTGFTEVQEKEFAEHSTAIACVKAPNMSIGVNLLVQLVRRAAEVLGAEYDVEIVEAHHRLKKDAPSGTAKELLRSAAQGLNLDPEKSTVTGRNGLTGERSRQEIGIFAVRGGDIIGDHTVMFAGPGERLEFIHRAHSRETFARGALRAARFAASAAPGLYDMQNVLGLRPQ